MALGVLQLHECRLVHTNLSLKYFKVSLQLHHNFLSLPHNTLIKFTNSSRYILFSQIFPIDEPPSHTNLRVKLVSLKHARDYNTPLSQSDILQLGLSMCAVAIGKCQCTPDSYHQTNRESLRSYDVSLMLLVDWMIDDDPSRRATIDDVVQHPYFMNIQQAEEFSHALHNGMFTGPEAGLVTQEGLDNALDEMRVVLLNEMVGIFGALSAEPEPRDDGDDGSVLPDSINLGRRKDGPWMMTRFELRQLAMKLPATTSVTSLDLSHQNMGPDMLLELAAPRALLTCLRQLNLAGAYVQLYGLGLKASVLFGVC